MSSIPADTARIAAPGPHRPGVEPQVPPGETRSAEPAATRATGARTDPSVVLRGAAVRGPRGPVFGPLDFASAAPATVVVGRRGSGRTSLLLALSGRMRLSSGSAAVLGETRLSSVRRGAGIAGFDGIDDLEPSVSVAATLRERLAWSLPWYRRAPRVTRSIEAELLDPVFGSRPQPAPETLVRDLGVADETLLRIALALVDEPSLLCVDDLDRLGDPDERALVVERLDALASTGTRVVVATSDPRDAHLFARTRPDVLRL